MSGLALAPDEGSGARIGAQRPAREGRSMCRHMVLGAFVGLAFALATFDVRYLAGIGPRWEHPSPDLVAYLAATYYYVDDAWRLPLFDVPRMGYPEGGSVIYNDAVPIGAFVAKIVTTVTGVRVVHLGPWIVLCYVMQGAFIARLAHLAGNRSLFAATALIAIALSSLIVLTRPEHIALISHFLLTWAFCVYVQASSAGRLSAASVGALAALTLLVNAYLFVMVTGVLAAAVITAIMRGARSGQVRRTIAVSTLVILVVVLVAGFVPTRQGGRLASWGFGYFSWNPATLVVPPPGLWPWGGGMPRNAPVGAPYEGESYLGFGAAGPPRGGGIRPQA